MTNSFANNFWGPDDAGVAPVLQRMHEAKQTCEELHAFFRERILIEEDYARRMSALAKKAMGSLEAGSLYQALESVRITTDAVAQAHTESTAQMKKELGEFDTFASNLRQKRKAIEANVERLHKLKAQQSAQVERARQVFEQDCHKLNGYSAQQNLLMGRELDKNNMKLEKAHMALDMSRRDYQTALRLLQDTTTKWNTEWKTSCDGFQDLEEERISYLKSHLWSYTNIVSSVCVKDDDGCEKVRVALEKCDVDADIASFVSKRGTGNHIANAPEFVDYLNGVSNPVGQSYQTASFVRNGQQPPQNNDENVEPNPYSTSSVPTAASADADAPRPSATSRRSSIFGGSPVNSTANFHASPSSSSPGFSNMNNNRNIERSIERTQSSSPLNKSVNHTFRDRHHSLFGETPHPVMSASPSIETASSRDRSESQGELDTPSEKRTWSSPFRRRSKRWQSTSSINVNANIVAGASTNSSNPGSSTSSSHTFGSSSNSNITNARTSPGVSQGSHSRSHSVLSMGENLFDLGVTSSETSRSASPVKKTLPKDDPLLAALQRLKVASSEKLNQPHPASSTERLAPPNAAFTAEEMNAAKNHYANQTSEMYGQTTDMGAQPASQQQRSRRGSSIDIHRVPDDRHNSMENVRQLQRPRSQYYEPSRVEAYDYQLQQQQQEQEQDYRDHRRSKSASPTKQDYMSFNNYPPVQHQMQQRAGGRSPSPNPQQMLGHHRSSSQLSQHYNRRSPSPQPSADRMQTPSPSPYARPLGSSPTPSTSSLSPSRRSKYPTVSRDGRPVLRHSRAAYDYRAAIPEEVSFRKGDVMSVLRMQDDGWWEVEVLSSGRFGLAPSNFLVTA